MAGRATTPGPDGPGGRILVVEDEADIAALVAYQLARDGFRVETAATVPEARMALDREVPDLLILDLMLPEGSGYDLLEELRRERETEEVPVIILTARKDERDRIRGLELGADDYVTKPFSPRELLLRARAVLRRVRQPPAAGGDRILRGGPVTVHVDAHRVTVAGEEVDLTPTEFRLLVSLMERPGRTRSRNALLEKAWDVESRIAERIQTRTVDMHIRRLRAKLGPAAGLVETVRGFGYRFRLPDGGAGAS